MCMFWDVVMHSCRLHTRITMSVANGFDLATSKPLQSPRVSHRFGFGNGVCVCALCLCQAAVCYAENTFEHMQCRSVILYDNVAEQSQLCFMPLCARTVVPPRYHCVRFLCHTPLSRGASQGGHSLSHSTMGDYTMLCCEQNRIKDF